MGKKKKFDLDKYVPIIPNLARTYERLFKTPVSDEQKNETFIGWKQACFALIEQNEKDKKVLLPIIDLIDETLDKGYTNYTEQERKEAVDRLKQIMRNAFHIS